MGVVGEIGTGKSTLLQIIQRFYQPVSGNITINDTISLNDIELSIWRDKLGVVSQTTHIFTGNVFYNISLDNDYNQSQIIDFCKSFGFDTFINNLPQSYFSIIGEEGVNLSGGQKQIIALARALYKNPEILLLDEVTASMDAKTEAFILSLLNHLKKQTLIIFVTHKIETLHQIANKTISL